MKRDVIEINNCPKINVLNKELYVPLKDIDFTTKHAVTKSCENLPGNQLLGIQFRKECLTFLSTTTKNLLPKCPLNYATVRHLRSLNPLFMIGVPLKFEKLLQLLLNAKWHTAQQCDQILAEYKILLKPKKLNKRS